MEIELFPAGQPLEGKWCLSWRSALMPAPAFEYFDSEDEAIARGERLRKRYTGKEFLREP